MLSLEENEQASQQQQMMMTIEPLSAQWFTARNARISGTDVAVILGKNQYQKQYQLLLKKIGIEVVSFFQKSNNMMEHGCRYEELSKLIYEKENPSKKILPVTLALHKEYSFLCATSDGFIKPDTLVEIKNPVLRKIIPDEIPPMYYIQIQIQLACYDLPKCHFIQTGITEYDSQKDYLDDEINNKSKYYKGIVIVLFDKESSKTIYQYSKMNIKTKSKVNEWIVSILSSLDTHKQEFKFIRYWKLEKYDIQTIERNTEWFASNIFAIKEFYDVMHSIYLYFFYSHPFL